MSDTTTPLPAGGFASAIHEWRQNHAPDAAGYRNISDELAELLLRYANWYYKSGRHLHFDHETCEDLAIDAALNMTETLRRDDHIDEKGAQSYFRQICANIARDHLRDLRKKHEDRKFYSLSLRDDTGKENLNLFLSRSEKNKKIADLDDVFEINDQGAFLKGKARSVLESAIESCTPLRRPMLEKIFLENLSVIYGSRADLWPIGGEKAPAIPTINERFVTGITQLKQSISATFSDPEIQSFYHELIGAIVKGRFQQRKTQPDSPGR